MSLPDKDPDQLQVDIEPIVVSPKNPYHVMLMLAAVGTGITGLIAGDAYSSPILKQLGIVFQYVWFSSLFVGGVIALTTVLLGTTVRALLWERIGLTLLTGIVAAYGVAYIGINKLSETDCWVFLIGIAIMAVLSIWHKWSYCIVVGLATLALTGFANQIIVFGFVVGNLFRMRDIKRTLVEVYKAKQRIVEATGQLPVVEDKP